jgi:hypothetical protein
MMSSLYILTGTYTPPGYYKTQNGQTITCSLDADFDDQSEWQSLKHDHKKPYYISVWRVTSFQKDHLHHMMLAMAALTGKHPELTKVFIFILKPDAQHDIHSRDMAFMSTIPTLKLMVLSMKDNDIDTLQSYSITTQKCL